MIGGICLTATRTRILLADVAMLCVAVLWGVGYPVSDALLDRIGPLWLLALRFSATSVMLLVLFGSRLKRLDRRQFTQASGVGLVLAVTYLLHIYGLVYTTGGKQAFIVGTNVVMVPFLMALLYRKWPPWMATAAAVVTTAGLLVMAFSPNMNLNFGDALSMVLALLVAIQVIVVGYCARRMDPIALASVQMLVTCALLLPLALVLEPFPTPQVLISSWKGILFLAAGPTVFAFVVQSMAQKHAPETHAAILLAMESPFGYLVSISMGLDTWSLQFAAGGVLILGGVFLAEWETFRK
jgi:drug/metabolite transporter (DMT)-like permease